MTTYYRTPITAPNGKAYQIRTCTAPTQYGINVGRIVEVVAGNGRVMHKVTTGTEDAALESALKWIFGQKGGK